MQITGGKQPIRCFVSDGARVYYATGNADPRTQMFVIGANGGEPVPMPRLTGMFSLDTSPDGSQMLLAQFLEININGPYPIWVTDTLERAPRRILTTFSPSGRIACPPEAPGHRTGSISYFQPVNPRAIFGQFAKASAFSGGRRRFGSPPGRCWPIA